MAEEHFEKTPKKAGRWFRAAIVFALLYGITFSLHSFFNWIFFFASVYAFFMSYFLLPVQPKIFQGGRRSSGSRSGPTQFNTGTGQAGQQDIANKVKRFMFTIVGLTFGMMVIFFIIGILNPEEEQQGGDYSVEGSATLSSQDFVSEGNQYFNESNYDSADAYYDRALALEPGNMEAVYGKGIVLWQRDRKDEAIIKFRQAYEGGFRYAWLSWVLADVNDKNGNTAQAIGLYKESVGLDSSYTDSYKRLAELEPSNRDKYLQLAQKYESN